MNKRHWRKRRLVGALVVAGASLAIAGPAAGAAGPEAPCDTLRQIVYAGRSHPGPAAPCYVLRDIVYGDDSTGLVVKPLGTSLEVAPEPVPTNVGAPTPGSVLSQTSSTVEQGFDWADAGIGAGTAFALVLLAGGTAIALRRHGRPAF